MKITIIKLDELCEVMQHLNLLKVKFGSRDTWCIAPMLLINEGNVDIIVNVGSIEKLEAGEEVIIKFQKSGYEYIVSGVTTYIGTGSPSVVTVKILMAQRYFNLRKYMRFDTNIKVIIKISEEQYIESTARNLSRGGAMVVSKADLELNSLVNIQITFPSQNSFTAIARVLRKSLEKENSFSYGIQFAEYSDNNCSVFNKEMLKYEREYLKTLDILKEYTNKTDLAFDTKISILCYGEDECYEIREILVKLGAENFDVFHDFRFYSDFFNEEKPKIVVVDSDCLGDDVSDVIVNIRESFPNIKVLLLFPLDSEDSDGKIHGAGIPGEVSVLFKPLIYNEFEEEIFKYL